MIWRFTARVKNLESFSDSQAESLYGRCPDATLSSSAGRAKIAFDREAPSLQAAIRTALADISGVGLNVASIEIEADDLAELPQ